MDKITHEVRLANWTNLIQDCLSSGLSKKQWCLENQVTTFVEVPPLSKIEEPLPSNPSAQIRVNGCTIEIADSASDIFIRRLLGALAHVQ